MSRIERYEAEIRRAGLFDGDSDYGGMLGPALLKLCKCMCDEGHSGFSHGLVTNLFHNLMMHDILTPLKGTDDEWNEVSEGRWQNNRASNVFKDADGCYQFDYYVFHDLKRSEPGYTSRDSRKRVTFPYMPSHEHVVLGRVRLFLKSCREWLRERVISSRHA